MYDYEAILASQALRVERAYPTQVTDPSHPAHGVFLSETSGAHPNADHGANASLLASACCVLLADGSRLKGDAELFERVQWSVAFQRRRQRPTGLIDLVGMNWESPPDTGFAVQILAPAVELERILAETIEINEDGEYTERSTGVYNAVCNRSLRFMADHLGNPDLLDPVRKNLDLMSHLFHQDGTVDTSFSGRQDRGQRIVPVAIADSFFDMAQRDGNGVWARIAECAFEGPGEWETADQVIQVTAGMTCVLKSGHGTFRRGKQAIRIGPGSGVHYDWQMRESEPSLDRFRVLITLQTPIDRTLEIRYGAWSLATRSLAGV